MPVKKTTTSAKSKTKTVATDVADNATEVKAVDVVNVDASKDVEVAEDAKAIKPIKVSKDVEPVTQKRTYKDGDYIMCHSVTAGGLNINCRSRNHYEFRDYGSECEIEYRDLVELIRKHSDHIFGPRLIIDDKDFLEDFPELRRFYAEQYTVSDFKEILKLSPDEMEREIKKLPNEVMDTIRSLAATMVGNGEIDSVRKVKVLTDVFGTDFNLLSELFSANK